MSSWKKIVFLMVPVFLLVSFLSTSSFAGNKKHKHWKKDKFSTYKNERKRAHRDWEREYRRDWRDEVRYSQGHHHHDCNLPPGLAKKGKMPPGWAKKCRHQKAKHHGEHRAKKHGDHYPDNDHKRTSGGHDKPTIEGGVDIGVGIHIPFP
jgi:hypothetical protein